MNRAALSGLALLLFSTLAQAQPPAAPRDPRRGHDSHMMLTSNTFADGGVVGDAYTMKSGQDAPSPDLTWSSTPAGTKSFALIMHDMDVVVNLGDSAHWLAFNIPGTATSLPAGLPKVARLPDGTIQALNRRMHGYFPPGAPPAFYHHYVIEVYALDATLPLDENATRDDILKAMDGHVLDRGVLFARSHI